MSVPVAPERKSGAGVLARVAGVALWVFAAGFGLGAAQVWRALHTGQRWANYRGEVIQAAELRHTLLLFAVAAAVCALLAWRWRRLLRRAAVV